METEEDKKFYNNVEPLIKQFGKIIKDNQDCVYCISELVSETAENHHEGLGILFDALMCQVSHRD